MDTHQIIHLPLPKIEGLEIRAILKKLSSANRHLADHNAISQQHDALKPLILIADCLD